MSGTHNRLSGQNLDSNVSPSRTYFPSHMSQTLSSVRRQSKQIYLKNVERYSEEDQVKALMRQIRQKQGQIKKKTKENT